VQVKFMLDTHIYDLIVATSGLVDQVNGLVAAGKATILCTHVQDDELANILDAHKRAEVLRINRRRVPTAGAVFGLSRYGASTYGDGSTGGIALDQVRSAARGHTKDALIASTASREADVLVTEDRRLVNRLRAISTSCQVWSFERFANYCQVSAEDERGQEE
jgi:hypothetical protein